MLFGNLSYNHVSNKVSVNWGKHDVDEGGVELKSFYAYKYARLYDLNCSVSCCWAAYLSSSHYREFMKLTQI